MTTFKLWFDAYFHLCHVCIILRQVCLAIQVESILPVAKENLYHIQGAPKKMYHSGLYLISVLKVGFYFFAYVLESEFLACFNWTPKQC